VHRIGRTGRAGASGIAISLCNAGDEASRLWQIERYIGHSLPQQVVEGLEPTRSLSKPKSNRSQNSSRRQSQGNGNNRNGRNGFNGKRKPAQKKKSSVAVIYR